MMKSDESFQDVLSWMEKRIVCRYLPFLFLESIHTYYRVDKTLSACMQHTRRYVSYVLVFKYRPSIDHRSTEVSTVIYLWTDERIRRRLPFSSFGRGLFSPPTSGLWLILFCFSPPTKKCTQSIVVRLVFSRSYLKSGPLPTL